jgi:ATP-dependent HslUV protease ATP-binding subunit HslU
MLGALRAAGSVRGVSSAAASAAAASCSDAPALLALLSVQSVQSVPVAGESSSASGGSGAEGAPPAGGGDASESAPPPEDKAVRELMDAMFKPKDVRSALGLQQNTMRPSEIVKELDKHIIGQSSAKKSVAIALRNRWRRLQLDEKLRAEVTPKNILMIGSTGVGKTEIGRRLAKLAQAPFVKVEATKYTEVGFHGRDVDKIIQDLVEVSINMTKQLRSEQEMKSVAALVENLILDILCLKSSAETRKSFRDLLRKGELDKHTITIDAPVGHGGAGGGAGGGMSIESGASTIHVQQIFSQLGKMGLGGGPKKEKRKVPIAEARRILVEAEMENRMDNAEMTREAIFLAEQNGIVFIDEIDKICSHGDHRSADASSEGVQRDLLPIIEGSVVNTKHGNVDTTNILFITSGAFHTVSPADLLPELQGRLPIRVTLESLTEHDLYRILTEPQANLIFQQTQMLRTEGLEVHFEPAAVKEMARLAAKMNATVEDIGARRLHTITEKLVEDISYHAPELLDAFKAGLPPHDSTLKDKYLIKHVEGQALPVLVIRKENVTLAIGDKLKDASFERFIL